MLKEVDWLSEDFILSDQISSPEENNIFISPGSNVLTSPEVSSNEKSDVSSNERGRPTKDWAGSSE